MLNNIITPWLMPAPSPLLFWQCFGVLLFISAAIALIAANISIKHLGNRKLAFFYFLLVVQVFTPVIGNIFAIAAIFLLRQYKKYIYPVALSHFETPKYIRREPVPIVSYAEGWASMRLNHTHFSEEERKQALISVSRGSAKNINPLFNELIADEMEELRIYAFSLLENQQNFLHHHIDELLQAYEAASNRNAKAFLAKQLAFLYWELVYLNLGELEFRKLILAKSKSYAEEALQVFQQDPVLLVLLARIAMQNKETDKGKMLLATAAYQHAPSSKVYPYLAEQAFLQRDFAHVRAYLGADLSFLNILKLRPVVNFWCENGRVST